MPTIALIAATLAELKPTLRRLRLRGTFPDFRGTFGGHDIVASVSGIGPDKAVAATRRIVERERVSHVVLLGFAGALDPVLQAAEIVPVRWVLREDGTTFHLDGSVPTRVTDAAAVRRGAALLTAAAMVTTPDAKRALHQRFPVSIVDMESFAVAKLLAELGVSATMVRAVSDTADTAMPEALLDLVRPDGRADGCAAIRFALSRPHRIPSLIRLGRHTARAGENLASWVESFLRSLPTAKPPPR